VVLGNAPDGFALPAARNPFAGLFAHRNFSFGKPADAADVILIPMRDQHLPDRRTELDPSATYPGNLVCRDRRVHHQRLTLGEHQQ
jgi:hypothetical protein